MVNVPEERSKRLNRRHRYRLIIGYLSISLFFLTCAASFEIWMNRTRLQLQTDTNMLSAWIIGITHGSKQQLTRGTVIQKWLSKSGVRSLGSQETLTSRYQGDSDAVELWLDYNSYLQDSKYLECHRIGQTAFVDDLGQRYHGFLDFHGRIVGLYLPGYDHAAHRITCSLHWCPRQQFPPTQFSAPMHFTFDLPRSVRQLPEANTLPQTGVEKNIEGISARVSSVRIVPRGISGRSVVQNQLSFHLKIEGGRLANSNVSLGNGDYDERGILEMLGRNDPAHIQAYLKSESIRRAGKIAAPAMGELTRSRFVISDPYGISLMPDNAALAPAMDWFGRGYLHDTEGWVWRAPVNGVGIGTDVVRIQFDVRHITPPNSMPAPTVHFDIVAPVQTSGEV